MRALPIRSGQVYPGFAASFLFVFGRRTESDEVQRALLWWYLQEAQGRTLPSDLTLGKAWDSWRKAPPSLEAWHLEMTQALNYKLRAAIQPAKPSLDEAKQFGVSQTHPVGWWVDAERRQIGVSWRLVNEGPREWKFLGIYLEVELRMEEGVSLWRCTKESLAAESWWCTTRATPQLLSIHSQPPVHAWLWRTPPLLNQVHLDAAAGSMDPGETAASRAFFQRYHACEARGSCPPDAALRSADWGALAHRERELDRFRLKQEMLEASVTEKRRRALWALLVALPSALGLFRLLAKVPHPAIQRLAKLAISAGLGGLLLVALVPSAELKSAWVDLLASSCFVFVLLHWVDKRLDRRRPS